MLLCCYDPGHTHVLCVCVSKALRGEAGVTHLYQYCLGGRGPKRLRTTVLGCHKAIFKESIKSSILALAYHDALLLCIFFHFHVYMIENIPFEKGETCHFFT